MEQKRILELALEALQKRKMQIDAEVEALCVEMHGSRRAALKRKTGPTVSAQRNEKPGGLQKEKRRRSA